MACTEYVELRKAIKKQFGKLIVAHAHGNGTTTHGLHIYVKDQDTETLSKVLNFIDPDKFAVAYVNRNDVLPDGRLVSSLYIRFAGCVSNPVKVIE